MNRRDKIYDRKLDNPEMRIDLILEGCLVGKSASERKLFELFYGYVMSICHRYSGSKEDAKEMLNDTFLTVFKYLDRYDSEYPFRPWIRKVAINCCLKHLKKYSRLTSKREVTFSKSHLLVDQKDDEESCQRLIQFLPPRYRAVFNLFVMDEYKHHEIAELLDISVGTSKSNLSRAKKYLEDILRRHPQLLESL